MTRKGGQNMWTRAELKSRGKESIRRNYWLVVLVALIAGILSGEFTGNVSYNGIKDEIRDAAYSGNALEFLRSPEFLVVLTALLGIAVVFFIGFTLIQIFVGNPLMVGCSRFFVENSDRKARFRLVGAAFQGGSYTNIVLTMFLRGLFTRLWTLLLIIPGIVKSYEYSMIPYILAENSYISRERAFQISKQMMQGQKFDAFVLDLSFFGWMILSAFTCGILDVFYVMPYRKTTWAEFYKVNRQMALQNGIAAPEELQGFPFY